MNQTWENSKRPNSEPDFGLFDPNMGTQIFLQVLPLLVFTHCCKLSSYAICKKINEPNLEKWQKKQFLGPVEAHLV